MNIDFHSEQNKYTYTGRTAHEDWTKTIVQLISPQGLRVADIGCGGGIYSAAWANLGAAEVIGIDFSAQMVTAANEHRRNGLNVSFRQGTAEHTGLAPESVDIVFARALIHHLPELNGCFSEAFRVLTPGGHVIIQDRTPEDVQIPGSKDHIRGYFFALFPRLTAMEIQRRPQKQRVCDALKAAGFTGIISVTVWETRRTYEHFEQLAQDLRMRTGRSILHYLNDDELDQLIHHIEQDIAGSGPIVEKDPWTIWFASKEA
uniref:class I SAM-dependent methyltransferase n=1 Tax=Klebsiella sp. TaxID=576 RepID=UPI0031D232CC